MMKIMTLHLQDKEKGVASPDVVSVVCGKLAYYGTKNHLAYCGMVLSFLWLLHRITFNRVSNNALNIVCKYFLMHQDLYIYSYPFLLNVRRRMG